jgi:hypothetical protein
MSDDLISRLVIEHMDCPHRIFREAADRLEVLEAENARLSVVANAASNWWLARADDGAHDLDDCECELSQAVSDDQFERAKAAHAARGQL